MEKILLIWKSLVLLVMAAGCTVAAVFAGVVTYSLVRVFDGGEGTAIVVGVGVAVLMLLLLIEDWWQDALRAEEERRKEIVGDGS